MAFRAPGVYITSDHRGVWREMRSNIRSSKFNGAKCRLRNATARPAFKTLAVLALCVYCAALGAATVQLVSNFELDGRPVLVPAVQEMKCAGKTTALPEEFTVRLPEGEKLIFEQLADALKRFPAVRVTPAAEGKTAFCRFILAEADVPEHDQGYKLTVDGRGIEVAARTPVGLFYGMQTLRNLLRNAAVPKLPQLIIRDRPDFDRRGYFFTLRFLPPERIPELKRALDAMAALKLNWLLLDTADCFPYEKYPLTLSKNPYTAEQLREIVDYCRARHIEITPTMQLWSHARWLQSHPDWPKMREGTREDWSCQYCPRNEEARRIVEQAVTEQVKFYSSKLFSPLLDEIYSGPFRTCLRCKELQPEKLLGDYVKFLEGVCRKLGVTMVVCQDALENRYWKYGDSFRNAFGSDTRILWWNYDDNLRIVWNLPVFERFKLVGHALCGKPLNLHNVARLVRQHGSRECTATYWYYSASGGVIGRLELETPDSLGGFVNSFDYLWRFTEKHYAKFDYDGTFEMMRLMYPEKISPFPAVEKAEPVPLESAVNAELSGTGRYPVFTSDASTAALEKILAASPERFRLVTSPGGKYYGVRLAGVPKAEGGRWNAGIGFGGRKVRKLSFLLTASIPTNRFDYGRCATKGPKRFVYAPAAALTLVYADGSRAETVLKYRHELTDWNRSFGGMRMRFAVRGVDDLGCHYNFGLFELANPHPGKAVDKIVFSTRRLDGISPVLLAVSARGLDRAFEASKAFDPAVLEQRTPAQHDPPRPTTCVRYDFEHGMGNVKVSRAYTSHDQLTGEIRAEVVRDPLSKMGNKALKLTVPPATNSGRGRGEGYIRISVDMPYTIAPGTKSVSFRHRFSRVVPPGFSHALDYLMHRDNEHYWSQRAVPGTMWRTTRIPFDRSSGATKPFADKTQTALRRVSFYFLRLPEPVEIWLDDFADSASDEWLPWYDGAEEEPN